MFSSQNLLQNSHYHIFMPIYVCMYVCIYVQLYVNLRIYRLQWLTFYDIFYAHADLVPISRRLGISDSNWENHVEGAVSRFESQHCSSCWITSEIYSYFFFFFLLFP